MRRKWNPLCLSICAACLGITAEAPAAANEPRLLVAILSSGTPITLSTLLLNGTGRQDLALEINVMRSSDVKLDAQARLSPTRRKMVFRALSAEQKYELFLADADGGRVTQLTSFADDDVSDARFVRNGESIWFLRKGLIYEKSLAGGTPKAVAGSPTDLFSFVVNRDDTKIYFTQATSGALHSVNRDFSGASVVWSASDPTNKLFVKDLSPDGTTLLYTQYNSNGITGATFLHAVRIDGSGYTTLDSVGKYGRYAAAIWSLAGSQVAFSKDAYSGNFDLYLSNGLDRTSATNMTNSAEAHEWVGAWTGGTEGPRRAKNDFDGDGLSDIGCYYAPLGKWHIYRSTEGYMETQFGYPGTVPVTGDFDGDGRTDFGCYYPPLGMWYVFKSTEGFWQTQFGYVGTVPVTGDFDGDGRADFGCYDPPLGMWYLFCSQRGFWQTQFGYLGTVPVVGDMDGDGKTDIGCYHAESGRWYFFKSQEGFWQTQFGFSGTTPLVGDFDADGRDDFGCFYAPLGNWYLFRSRDGFMQATNGAGGIPVVGNFSAWYRQAEAGVYYPASGQWKLFKADGTTKQIQFGYAGTVPLK